jgi:hypothetical protein
MAENKYFKTIASILYYQYPSTGSSTLGEKFNPAKDCSDIVDNLPEAKDGFYWIKYNKGKLSKVPHFTTF